MISPSRLKKSFVYAARGLSRIFREEQNFRLELAVGLIVLLLAWLMKVSSSDKAILTLTIGFVLLMEIVNSLVELMSDLLKPKLDVYVRAIKDVGAAAVLLAALTAVLIGVFIFSHYL
ncbi:MAG: diacylglycerol kinase [Candidatus Falkowbacteria bacterium]